MRAALRAALIVVLAIAWLALPPAAPAQAPPGAPAAPAPAAAAPAPAAAPTGVPYTSLAPKSAAFHLHKAAPKPASAAAPPPGPPGAKLAPGAPLPPGELEAFIDGVVREAMARDHIAGVAVSVVQNGQVVMKKGYGFAGPGRPVDPDQTLFRVGSITKTFTWIALMKEAEAGRIRLDAPVNLFLPEPLQIKDQGFSGPVMVRDLLNHSAGFEDRAFGQLIERDPGQIRPLTQYLRQERPRRVRPAGQLSVYSNYGAGLAGAAVSYVNGHPYQDVVDSEIIKPLGLSHTTILEPYPARPDLPPPMPQALAAQVSAGYRWAGGTYQPQDFEYVTQIAPAGALSSTAADMGRYMLMILGGGQLDGATIYGPATAKAFRTSSFAPAPGLEGWDDGFMEVSLPGGFHGQGHEGDSLWFHSDLVTVPDLGLGVFVTTNTDTGRPLATALPKLVVERFYAAPPGQPLAGSADLVNNRDLYAGTYLNDRRAYHGLEKFIDMLSGEATVRVTDDGRLITSDLPSGVRAWAPDGPAGQFRQVDGPGRMAFDATDSPAKRFFAPWAASAFERVGVASQIRTLVLLAVLTAIASIATLVGATMRRETRQTETQLRASSLQTTGAILWLASFAAFGAWAGSAANLANVMYHWPGPFLLVASACALVASVLGLAAVILAPIVWRGGRRLDSWTVWRRIRFTITTVIFAAFAAQLALWGALEPWSG
jgi:CubicO group peptidase (beta-lactamase class C family)